MSSFATLISIFTEPGKAMSAVLERSMILLPLFLLVVGTAALQFGYFQVVDTAWLQDYLLSANVEMDAAQREQARAFMNPTMMTGMAVISTLVMIPLVLVISAVYYLLAAKVIGNELGFGKWFAFATWSAVPTLLLLPLGVVQILLNDNGQLPPEALNPLSLNALIAGLPNSNAWAGLLNAISLPSLWAIAVAIVGMRVWTGKSWGVSSVIVLLPQVVFYGIWAAIAAMTAARMAA